MSPTIEMKFQLKFVLKKSIYGVIPANNWAHFGSKMVKSDYFQSFHFCFSVLQTHNINQYGSGLSDEFKNIFFVKICVYVCMYMYIYITPPP